MNFVPPANSLTVARGTRALTLFFTIIVVGISSAGCHHHPSSADKIALVPVNSLAKEWSLPIDLSSNHDETRGLYLREDTLFLYSQRNRVVAVNAATGKPLFLADVTPDQVPLKAPLLVKDKFAFPGGSTIEVYSKAGKLVDTLSTKRSMRSGGAPLKDTIYVGLDYPAGGRLGAIDLTRRYDRARWEFMIRSGITAAPAVFQNTIYFGSDAGAVYALSEEQGPAWPLEHSAFQTDGSIVADLKADEGGVYAASTDSKLYCLEGSTGKIRWQYYGSTALTESPAITNDTVYLPVPKVGIVAIDKVQGKFNRDAKWIAPGATGFLSQDEKYVYLRGAGNRIIACDRATGDVKFHSQRDDFVAFASNTKTANIYAATREGMIYAIKPITTPGTVGTLVLAPVPMTERVAIASRE